jgi:nucleoside phosphorylase
MAPKILVTFALRHEGLSFERKLTRRAIKHGLTVGQLGGREIAVFPLGVGVRNKEGFRSAVRELNPEFVVNSGFAGAVRTLLEPGDFVLANNCTSPELSTRPLTAGLFEAQGRFASVDEVADAAIKERINLQGDVVAVDMESAQIAALCADLAVPCLSAKMISDRYDESIPGLFLGRAARRIKDLTDAIWFASRMLVLRSNLADLLVALIRSLSG